jgi:hypothetical protein
VRCRGTGTCLVLHKIEGGMAPLFGEVQTLATAPQGPIGSPALGPAGQHPIFYPIFQPRLTG